MLNISCNSLHTVVLSWWLSGKESPCNAGDASSVPELGRFPAEESTHSSILAWKIPWAEEPCRLQSMGLQKSWIQLIDETAT